MCNSNYCISVGHALKQIYTLLGLFYTAHYERLCKCNKSRNRNNNRYGLSDTIHNERVFKYNITI